MTYDNIMEAINTITENWGDAGKHIIELLFNNEEYRLDIPCSDFLDYCSACGGNWNGMLLTGIKRKAPEVWKAIPEDMGDNAWNCIVSVLALMGVKLKI